MSPGDPSFIAKEVEINMPGRECAFLAQIAHESGEFQWFCEFGTDEYFQRYARRAEELNVAARVAAWYW
jgi:predicted chitinase